VFRFIEIVPLSGFVGTDRAQERLFFGKVLHAAQVNEEEGRAVQYARRSNSQENVTDA